MRAVSGPIPRLLLLVTGLLLGGAAPSLVAQTTTEPLRVGLALSGGSAKGFAHIGVLRVLEREGIPVQVVAGTSMGSILGGLYSLGVSVDSLEALAVGLDWDALFSDRVERGRLRFDQRLFDERTVFSVPLQGSRVRLPTGAVEGVMVQRLLDRLTWKAAAVRDFRTLPRPFAAVATDLETGEAVRLTEGVMSHALRASMGLPAALEPFTLGTRVLVDGGLARNLPAEDARALGADFVICSDVSDPLGRADQLESAVDVLMQTVAFRMEASTLEQREMCDMLIRPDIDGLSSLSFNRAAEWIARGEAAADARSTALEFLAGSAAPFSPDLGPRAGLLTDAVLVQRIDLVGAEDPSVERLVRTVLGIEPGVFVTSAELDAAVRDLYATDLFQSVRYRLDRTGGQVVLVVQAQPRTLDRVGLGFRSDEIQRSALLFAATLHNRFGYGSTLRVDARLGEEMQFRGTLFSVRGGTRRLNLGGTVSWTQSPLDSYRNGQRVSRNNLKVSSATAVVGVAPSRSALLAMEFRGERARGSTSVAVTDSTERLWLGSVAAVARRDSYDQTDFPRRGGSVYARSEVGMTSVGSGGSFAQHVLTVRHLVPVAPGAALDLGFFVGRGTGTDLPFYRHFYVGGVHESAVFRETQPTFFGLRNQELEGRAAHVLRLGVQWEVRRDRLLTVSANGGGVGATLGETADDYFLGWAVSAGARTMVGPVALTLSGGSGAQRARLSFSIGRRF